MRVLAGDIGGTKTHLAVVEVGQGAPAIVADKRYDSHAFPELGDVVRAFLHETSARFERACFGVAGPVVDDRSETTNLPWHVDARALSRDLGLGPTRLVNDFVAAAYGVLAMDEAHLAQLNPGARVPQAPIAVLGAGTGLGEAFLFWAGGSYQVVASEGSHADYAPHDERTTALLVHLRARYGHVSWERVVSGKFGLPNLYEYLRDTGAAPETEVVRDALAAGEDPGAVITKHALTGDDALSVQAMDLFVRAYGAEAGNLALKVVARGGVFLCGGIAPRILPLLSDGRFRGAFVSKGRLGHLVESVPVFVVTHPLVGLLGAALAA